MKYDVHSTHMIAVPGQALITQLPGGINQGFSGTAAVLDSRPIFEEDED